MTRTQYRRHKTGNPWVLKLKVPITPRFHISVYDENKKHIGVTMVERISNRQLRIVVDEAKYCWVYEEGVGG